MAKDSFLLYQEHRDIFQTLDDEEAGQLIKAIFEYEDTGQINDLDKSLKIAFIPIKNALDRNREKYEKVVERNKQNIEKRWNKNNTKNTTGKFGIPKNTKNTDNDSDNDNDNDNVKEKRKEKKIHFAEFVSMTNTEYEKLVSTYGKKLVDQCINILDNYKGSSGKNYKSDYRAILSWVIDKIKENKPNENKKTNFNQREYKNLDFLYKNL